MKKLYKIYRSYTEKEKSRYGVNDDTIYKGWTDDEEMVEAFFMQRNPKKYNIEVTYHKKPKEQFSSEWKLDILTIRSKNESEEVPIIASISEWTDAINSVDDMFRSYCHIEGSDEEAFMIWFMNHSLKEEYKAALHAIGYENDKRGFLYEIFKEDSTKPIFPSPYRKAIMTLESFIKVMECDM